jgi:regulator of sigma E protease
VIAAGPLVNVVLAFLILFALFAFKGEAASTKTVDAVQQDAPAAQSLRPGDELVSVDGVAGDQPALRRQISTHKCAGPQVDGCSAETPATVVVRRDGRLQTLKITPKYDAQAKRPLLGFSFGVAYDPLPVGEAASRSVTGMWDVTEATVSSVVRLFYDSQARKEVGSVVGGYEATRQSFKADDVVLALQILALISLSLAIINLFPFLPLDGGHIFWALAEKVRGRPIPFRLMEQASIVGFVLVMMLFAIGLTNDIDRLRGEGFGIR